MSAPETTKEQLWPSDGPYLPPWRAYENPPMTPVRLNRVEREAAIRYWQGVGVLDERGRVREQWKGRLNLLFRSSSA